jgi:hypothetical protein
MYVRRWTQKYFFVRLDSSVEFHIHMLPTKSAVRKRVVQWVHFHLGHWTSVAVVTNPLRKRFWSLQVYEYVRSIIRHCFECQNLNHQLASQKFGDLPKERVQYENEKKDCQLQVRLHTFCEPEVVMEDLAPRRREMYLSTHPADDDYPSVYIADSVQICLAVGDQTWESVLFIDQLNAMTSAGFASSRNMACFIGVERYWWEHFDDNRYRMERRQCIVINLRRSQAVGSSDQDYISALSDVFGDGRQRWRNKTGNFPEGCLLFRPCVISPHYHFALYHFAPLSFRPVSLRPL